MRCENGFLWGLKSANQDTIPCGCQIFVTDKSLVIRRLADFRLGASVSLPVKNAFLTRFRFTLYPLFPLRGARVRVFDCSGAKVSL